MVRRFEANEVEKIALILKNNGTVSVPTDTVFGICARIDSKEAYNKLVEVKKRPLNKAFPVMCADKEQIKSIAVVNKKAEKLMEVLKQLEVVVY